MDVSSIVVSVLSTLGIGSAGAWWLGRAWIEHRLGVAKSEIDGEIKQKVDEYLTIRSAEVEYEFDARKRLYSAIGPHRFQLLLACKDFSSRVSSYGMSDRPYSLEMNSTNYFGRDTLYRFVKPLAIAEIIERQMAIADFTIDASAVGLLHFNTAVTEALSGSALTLDHPAVDWNYQKEHLFKNSIREVANSLIIEEQNGQVRSLRYHELVDLLNDQSRLYFLEELIDILSRFDINKKPIFWARLVCYGQICAEFVNRYGRSLGFKEIQFDSRKLISQSKDTYTLENVERYKPIFDQIADTDL